jgi:hypothetical protein
MFRRRWTGSWSEPPERFLEPADRSPEFMPAPPVEPSSDDATSATICVVEPDILVRMVIADYLRDCGYKVVEGVSADEVLAVLDAGRKIDVIPAEVRLAGSLDGKSM